jgi:hypothetical protein
LGKYNTGGAATLREEKVKRLGKFTVYNIVENPQNQQIQRFNLRC